MDLCILTFDGAHTAEDLLEEAVLLAAEGCPWLLEVNVVSRSALGRLRILASRLKNGRADFVYEEGELAAKAAELDCSAVTSSWWSAAALDPAFAQSLRAAVIVARDVERRFFHTRALKDLVSCNASALLLVASGNTCIAMINLFTPHHPRVMRRHVPAGAADCLASLDSPDDLLDLLAKAYEVH